MLGEMQMKMNTTG